MALSSRTALSAGAGIGGLAAGLGLRRAGWTVRLFERASSLREPGYDLMLASNAIAALRELGVAERVQEWFLTASEEEADGRDSRSLADSYTRRFGEPFESVARATRDADLRSDVLSDADPLAHWGRGPVTLLGDAAHPMLPHAGQGAAQALEDAVALGLALGAEIEPQAGLRRYEVVRARRTARVVRLARRLAWVRTTSSPTVAALRGAAIRWGPLAALHLTRLYRPGDPHAALR